MKLPLLREIAELSVLNGKAKSVGPLPERPIRVVWKLKRYHKQDAALIARALVR